ncbi:MAG: hypothetical protein KF817_15590 [Phycisphaeraceae bacterium]|nr:hypothetical protein [Phycisphaeraceae bacterium]
MTSTIRPIRPVLLAMAAALALPVLGGCGTHYRNQLAEEASLGGNVRVDPHSGEVFRLYRYYPDHEVYQSVSHGAWYWQNGDSMPMHGRVLPTGMTIGDADFYVLLDLPTRRPFTLHGETVAQYPSTETLMAQNRALEQGASDERYVTAPTDF